MQPARYPSTPPDILCFVLAALSWRNIYPLVFRRSQLTALQSAALICVWSSALYLQAYILFGLSRITGASASEMLVQTTYQGVCMSVVALVAFNRAIAIPGSREAAAIMASVPVMATLLAAPILGEGPSLPAVVAIAIIALGVIMAVMAAPVTPFVHSSHTHPANKTPHHDPILFPSDTQPRKSRTVSRRNRAAVRSRAGRHEQRRSAHARISRG
jgi:drug/metabolite transporter (DMT)-like permease